MDNDRHEESQNANNEQSDTKLFRRRNLIRTLVAIFILLALFLIVYFFYNSSVLGSRDTSLANETSGGTTSVTTVNETDGTTEVVQSSTEVHTRLVLEADSAELDANDFVIEKEDDAVVGFTGDISHVDLKTPGEYNLQLVVGTEVFDVVLEIVDTTTPVLELRQNLILAINVEITPDLFILKSTDNTELTFEFIQEPDSSIEEEQEVVIEATDLGGNTISASTTVSFANIKSSIEIEAGSVSNLSVEDFKLAGFENIELEEITSLANLDLDKVGVIPVRLLLGGETEVVSTVVVVDTVAPAVTTNSVTDLFYNSPVGPETVIASIDDATTVTVEWVTKPNYTQIGEQNASIRVTDEGNNSVIVQATVNVLRDEVAPTIHGVSNRTYIPGESASLLNGVYATDDRDPSPTVELDDSKLNTGVDGTYTVTYIATDMAGNETRKTANITVKNRTPYEPKGTTGNAELDRLADSILSQIINGDMSKYEQTRAIYSWLVRSFTYRAQPNRTDYIAGAFTGFRYRTGDCYIYAFTNQALLTRAGIDSYMKVADDGRHAWIMANIGSRYVVSDPTWNFFDVTLEWLMNRAYNLSWKSEREQERRIENVEVEVDFKIIREASNELYEGEERIVTEGVKGKSLRVYQLLFENGEEIERTLISENETTKPVNQVVIYGTKVNSAPVITSPKEININLGSQLNLKDYVSASDAEDGALEFTSDTKNLNINRAGSYEITVTAKDKRNLATTVKIVVNVISPTTEATTQTPSTTEPTTTQEATTTTKPTTTPEQTNTPTPTTTTEATTTTTVAPTTTSASSTTTASVTSTTKTTTVGQTTSSETE